MLDHLGWETCWACLGSGEFVACPDDLCHGMDECIHGDDPVPCEECGGLGELRPKEDDEDFCAGDEYLDENGDEDA